MDNIVGRLQSLFPSHQRDVMMGSLLGDARLECRSRGLRSPMTARFRVHHGERQKEYVYWKYGILKDMVLREPQEASWDNPKRGLHEVSWYFHTKSLPELAILYHYFYRNNVKILPDDIFDLVTPAALAVWFMDDGSNTHHGITMNTHGFTHEEHMRLIYSFQTVYGLNARLVRDRTKFKLAFGKREHEKLIAVVRPHIIPSMTYKINNPRNDLVAETTGAKSDFAKTSVLELEHSGKGIV